MTCMAMRDKFAPRLVAIVANYHALLFEPLDICRLQLYENRVLSMCLYSIITSHKKYKFIS